ncbi:hypothetical protein AAC387_Pa07g1237 [Persea americana]
MYRSRTKLHGLYMYKEGKKKSRRTEQRGVRKSYELLRIVPKTTISTGSSKPGKDATILRITNKSGKEKSMFEIIYDGQSIKEASASEQYHSRGAFGFPHWIELIIHCVTLGTWFQILRIKTDQKLNDQDWPYICGIYRAVVTTIHSTADICTPYSHHQVTTATGLINLRQTTEVPISHEEMHTLQDIIDGIPQA